MKSIISAFVLVFLLTILIGCTKSSNGLYIKELSIESDLPTSEFSYEFPSDMIIIKKNGEQYFAIYPLYPGLDIKKEYNFTEPLFVSAGSINIYEQIHEKGKFYAAETSYPFFVIPGKQPVSKELEDDMLLFLRTLKQR